MENKNYLLLSAGLTAIIVFTGILLAANPSERGPEGSTADLQNSSFSTSSEVKITEGGRKYVVSPDKLL